MHKDIVAKCHVKRNRLDISTSFTTTNDDFCLMELENLVCGDDVISADVLPIIIKRRATLTKDHMF